VITFPGLLHVDIKYLAPMPDETHRRDAFAAIDRATRWVDLRSHRHQSEQSSVDFQRGFHRAIPVKSKTSRPTTAASSSIASTQMPRNLVASLLGLGGGCEVVAHAVSHHRLGTCFNRGQELLDGQLQQGRQVNQPAS
jgi:hypothetical protein